MGDDAQRRSRGHDSRQCLGCWACPGCDRGGGEDDHGGVVAELGEPDRPLSGGRVWAWRWPPTLGKRVGSGVGSTTNPPTLPTAQRTGRTGRCTGSITTHRRPTSQRSVQTGDLSSMWQAPWPRRWARYSATSGSRDLPAVPRRVAAPAHGNRGSGPTVRRCRDAHRGTADWRGVDSAMDVTAVINEHAHFNTPVA